MAGSDLWPPLPYAEWRATRDTLHMYTQVVGKLRLMLSPFEPGWGNVPLYVTPRGLTTSPIPYGLISFDAEFDLFDHVLVLRTSDGQGARVALGGAVSDFYRDALTALQRVGIDVDITVRPQEVAEPIPFPDDHTHHTYNAEHARRFHHVLAMVDIAMREHRARFHGRTSPVQFFWGTFDLALTRYSGRLVTPPAGGGVIARFGGEAEQICAGWWPGDERNPEPAFFSYAYPAPPGLEAVEVRPKLAAWSESAREFLMPYELVRATDDPRQAILDFFDSTYRGAAALLGWDDELISFPTPAPLHVDTHRTKT